VDRFGITWQIVPGRLQELLSGNGDPATAERVWRALMPMVKIDLRALEAAFKG
jgi:predicted 3-demethylubiquinone-9 3-methyltransferase (glyoxalase superfamily)